MLREVSHTVFILEMSTNLQSHNIVGGKNIFMLVCFCNMTHGNILFSIGGMGALGGYCWSNEHIIGVEEKT